MSTREQAIEEVMSFCSISNTDATKLLSHFDWNIEDAINTFLTDPSIIDHIGTRDAVSDLSLSDSTQTPDTTPSEPVVIEEDVHNEDELYEEEDEPSTSEVKNWNSSKLEKMFSPPADFLTNSNLFTFLKQLQDEYKTSNKHLFSRTESPKRTKSLSQYFIPIVFIKDSDDFLSQAIYRDTLKHQSIIKKLTSSFKCIEIEYKDPATKLFCKKYSVKHDMCLMFLHPLTWELIEVIYRVDLKNRNVVKGVIESIIRKINTTIDNSSGTNTNTINITNTTNVCDKIIEEDYKDNNGNFNVKNYVVDGIKEDDLIKFKVYSEFGLPSIINVSKNENVKDLINRTLIHFKRDENIENYQVKPRGPIMGYIEHQTILKDSMKFKDVILVNINK